MSLKKDIARFKRGVAQGNVGQMAPRSKWSVVLHYDPNTASTQLVLTDPSQSIPSGEMLGALLIARDSLIRDWGAQLALQQIKDKETQNDTGRSGS